MSIQDTLDKIKSLIKKGNVSRVIIRRGDTQILNLSVNLGLVGVAVGLSSAKWALLASVLAAVGFGCTVEVVKSDGQVVNVMDEGSGQKVREFASDTVEKVKESIPVTISVDVKRDNGDILDADVEPSEENTPDHKA